MRVIHVRLRIKATPLSICIYSVYANGTYYEGMSILSMSSTMEYLHSSCVGGGLGWYICSVVKEYFKW